MLLVFVAFVNTVNNSVAVCNVDKVPPVFSRKFKFSTEDYVNFLLLIYKYSPNREKKLILKKKCSL